MFKIRERKIWADIVARKARTSLVSLSIMMGVFGIVALISGGDILIRKLRADIQQGHLPRMRLYVTSVAPISNNEDILTSLETIQGVTRVEGQANYPVYWKQSDETRFHSGFIRSFSHPFDQIQLEPPTLLEGRYPTAEHPEIALERRMAEKFDLTIGESLIFRMPDQSEKAWQIVGILYHPYLQSALGQDIPFEESIYTGYVEAQSLAAFPGLNVIFIRFSDNELVETTRDQIRQTLITNSTYIPSYEWSEPPEDYLLIKLVNQFRQVIGVLSLAAMIVSAFLVTNVMNSVIVEQHRQIAVLKSMGATRADILLIYCGTALLYGILGTIPGILMGIPSGFWIAKAVAPTALTIIDDFQFSALGIVIGAFMGLSIPVMAAFVPAWNATRVNILKTFTDLGIASPYGNTLAARILARLPLPPHIRQGMSSFLRQPSRFALTLIALSSAAASFMGVLAVFGSLNELIMELETTFDYQVAIRPYSPSESERLTELVQQIKGVEAVYPGFEEIVWIEGYHNPYSDTGAFNTPQAFGFGEDLSTPVFQMDLLAGQNWQTAPRQHPELVPVVITQGIATQLGVSPGDMLHLMVSNHVFQAEIVGIDDYPFDLLLMESAQFADLYDYTTKDGLPLPNVFRVQMEDKNPTSDEVGDLISDLAAVLQTEGINVGYINRIQEVQVDVQRYETFNLLFNLTSIILGFVGAIGLVTTLFMSVFERQKEIGVMRSVGASTTVIVTQFLAEGVGVGLVAWILAVPASNLFARLLVQVLPFGSWFQFHYPMWITGLGLLSILILSLAASIIPAITAARKTVSDILRYQ